MNKKTLIISLSAVVILIIIFVVLTAVNKEEKNETKTDYINCVSEESPNNHETFQKGNYTYNYVTIQYEGKDYSGWEVKLTDKDSQTANGQVCKTVNGENVISANGMFQYSNADEIDVSQFDTSTILFMKEMFRGTNATSIKGLESMNTSNVLDMSVMFADTNFETLNLSQLDTSKVTQMVFMFSNSSTPELDLSSFDTRSLKHIDGIFSDNSSENINVSNWNLSNIAQVKDFFYNCTAKINFGSEEDEKAWHDLMYQPIYE